jgi:hypothetical protein
MSELEKEIKEYKNTLKKEVATEKELEKVKENVLKKMKDEENK